MTDKQLRKLIQKDLMDFINIYGKNKLNELINSGNIPIRQSTQKLVEGRKLVINKDYTKYL